MTHPGLLGGMARPCAARKRCPERNPGRLEASCGAGKPALTRPQHDGPRPFSHLPTKHGHVLSHLKHGHFLIKHGLGHPPGLTAKANLKAKAR